MHSLLKGPRARACKASCVILEMFRFVCPVDTSSKTCLYMYIYMF